MSKLIDNGTDHHIHSTNGRLVGRSEMMEEIVSENPGFLLNWGNLFLAVVLGFIGVALWVIKYPDKVEAEAKLTSLNAPKMVVNNVGGKLVKLNVKEGEEVHKGQILGYMEALASHDEVIGLSTRLDSIRIRLLSSQEKSIDYLMPMNGTQFGELQSANQGFIEAYLSFKQYLPNGIFHQKLSLLEEDYKRLEMLNFSLIEERDLQVRDVALTETTFEVNKALKKDKVISDFDFRNEESKLLSKKLGLPRINSAILTNKSLQSEKKKELIDLISTIEQQRQIFQQAVNTFNSQVEEWKHKFLITAPISGSLNFVTFVEENQQLEIAQPICYINQNNADYFAEVVIPQSNFGKVRIGQAVLLKFHSYPFQEFGAVEGRVDFISDVPASGGYLAKVVFINGLSTNYGQSIQYRPGLVATAEIITKERTLFERFFSSLKM
ncbi:MAG: HlyD family efflux transporter periplasmic adaptor subunit [Imperialibacter sp.]|uniref:HlyD family secretion protein n=1 Tax=Imperialibacter sp. TaxID=2038411 RepID=UPI0032F00952